MLKLKAFKCISIVFNMMGESEITLVILIIITGDTVHYAKLDV